MSKQERRLFEFGPYRLLPSERLLLCNGKPVSLAPKAFETLVALVERGGRLVEKDELLNEVWAGTSVEESNVAQNVFTLRRVLGRSKDGGHYIETVPKRGYRFTAEVEEVYEGWPEAAPWGRAGATPRTEKEPGSFDSLAVLPLLNEGDDPDAEYLSEGITESIIDRLSRLPRLKVKAHSSVVHYKGREVSPQDVGRDLGVSAVLTGRLRQSGGRLVVRAELVDTAAGWRLW